MEPLVSNQLHEFLGIDKLWKEMWAERKTSEKNYCCAANRMKVDRKEKEKDSRKIEKRVGRKASKETSTRKDSREARIHEFSM